MIQVIISSNDQNMRLDKFVKKYLYNAPSSFIYKLFRKKDIKVNKKPQDISYITRLNDVITIYISKEQEEEFLDKKELVFSNKKNFEVIYEDENVLVVNKPDNLLVHDGDDKSKNEDTLTKQVLSYLIENNSYDPNKENVFVPSLAHRIDRNTSGVVIFGKTSIALKELFEAFKNHEGMDKEYLALVSGVIRQNGKIEAKLIKNEKTKIVNVDEVNGKSAITLYEVIKTFKDATLLKIKILTGRTHQIRVHMKYINHPLIGDLKYGSASSDKLAKKYWMSNYFLHAKKICFHNLKNELAYLNNKEFIAPLFDNKKQIINRLLKEDNLNDKH
ncbi:MAG: RluA family pseudouridine synthase [Erysipelotrichaceae bacterium]|nr:RluA family pseudouridine synthase [Erysipelotrichaceae bacterium]